MLTVEPLLYEGDDGWWIAIAPPGGPHLLMAAGKTEHEAREMFAQAHEQWKRKRGRRAD